MRRLVAESITLYSGQHVADDERAGDGIREVDRNNCQRQYDDEDSLANLIVVEGAHSPADSSTPRIRRRSSTCSRRDFSPRSTRRRSRTRRASTTHRKADWVGVSARVSVLIYNPSLINQEPAPDLGASAGGSEVLRQAWHSPPGETDFQPIVTSVVRAYGKPAALTWLKGIKANAGGHVYPGQRDDRRRGEPRRCRLRSRQPVLLVQDARGDRCVQHSLADHLLRSPRSGLRASMCPARGSSSRAGTKSDAQRFLAFLVSTQGQEIIAHSISFEYPIASGVTTSQPETPFDQLQPYSDHHLRAGRRLDGHRAVATGRVAVIEPAEAIQAGRVSERPVRRDNRTRPH